MQLSRTDEKKNLSQTIKEFKSWKKIFKPLYFIYERIWYDKRNNHENEYGMVDKSLSHKVDKLPLQLY